MTARRQLLLALAWGGAFLIGASGLGVFLLLRPPTGIHSPFGVGDRTGETLEVQGSLLAEWESNRPLRSPLNPRADQLEEFTPESQLGNVLEVRVVSGSGADERPVSGWSVELVPSEAGNGGLSIVEPTGTTGAVQFCGLREGSYVIIVPGADPELVRLTGHGVATSVLRILACAQVQGRVVDPNGRAALGAMVSVCKLRDVGVPTARAITNVDGRFGPLPVIPGWFILAEHEQWLPSSPAIVTTPANRLGEFELSLSAGPVGKLVVLVVSDDGGTPSKARVSITPEVTGTGSNAEPRHTREATRADGQPFEFGGLPLGWYRLTVHAPDFVCWSGRRQIENSGESVARVSLVRGIALAGVVVRGSDQMPVGGVQVWARAEGRGVSSTLTQPDGHFRLTELPRMTVELIADDLAQGSARGTWNGSLDEEIRLVLQRGRVLHGRVTNAEGLALAGMGIGIAHPGRRGLWIKTTTTGGDGTFEFAACPDGPVTLQVFQTTPAVMQVLWELPPAEVTTEPRLIVIPNDALKPHQIVGRVECPPRSPSGGGIRVHFGEQGRSLSAGTCDETTGEFRAGPLFQGVYVVRIDGEYALPSERLVACDAGSPEVIDLGSIEVECAGSVRLEPGAANDGPLDITIADHDGVQVMSSRLHSRGLESRLLRPGAYRVTWRANGHPETSEEIEVRCGRTTKVRVRLP